MTLHFGDVAVEVLLADADIDGEYMPSADNVVVLFPPESLSKWAGSHLNQ
jgi:hypothetical protein